MSFEKGHQLAKHATPNSPIGKNHRRQLRNLAMRIREDPRCDTFMDHLFSFAVGIDPHEPTRIVERAVQLMAIKMLLERGWGQPAQHVVVEGLVKQELIAQQPVQARAQLSLEEIKARRERLLKVLELTEGAKDV